MKDIMNLFDKPRETAITYEEYHEYGLEKEDFLYLVSLCEEIRAVSIVTLISVGISNNDSKNKPWLTALEQLGEELSNFLARYSVKKVEIDLDSLFFRLHCKYFDVLDYKEIVNPSSDPDVQCCKQVYLTIEDFRNLVETYICSKIQNNSSNGKATYEELSESLKEFRKAYKKNKEPDFEVDLNDSKKVAEWAKKYFEYYDLFTYGEANIDFMKDDLNELRHAAQNPYNIKVYQGGAVAPK